MRISDWSSDVCSSDLRPLNKRGARAAATMGQYARSHDMHFDYLIASPALRVTETLDEFLEAYGQNVEANWDRRIYLASSATLMDVLRDIPEDKSDLRSEEHTSELQSLMRISYAVFCLKKKRKNTRP